MDPGKGVEAIRPRPTPDWLETTTRVKPARLSAARAPPDVGQELHLRRIAEVAGIDVERAVAIEEDGLATRCRDLALCVPNPRPTKISFKGVVDRLESEYLPGARRVRDESGRIARAAAGARRS